MKKIFTLLAATFISFSLFAYDGTRLSITAPSTSTQLKIEIDGRPFSVKDNAVTVSYFGEGYHQVKIYKDKGRTVFGANRKQEILFNSSIFLKKGFHTDITVNRFGKVMTDEHFIDVNDEWYNDEDEMYDNNGGWNTPHTNMMTGREFETLKDQLRREWSETNRLTSVKFIIAKTDFTTAQVKDLMLLFTFETNRLEVAKAAYCKTVDQRNYFQLNEVLTFSSSKQELARFIRESQ